MWRFHISEYILCVYFVISLFAEGHQESKNKTECLSKPKNSSKTLSLKIKIHFLFLLQETLSATAGSESTLKSQVRVHLFFFK